MISFMDTKDCLLAVVIYGHIHLKKAGYVTFNDSEEEVYKIIYDELFGYANFDTVPEHTQKIYSNFISAYHDHS